MAQGHFIEGFLIYLAILALVTPATSQTTIGPPANPYLDPQNDTRNPLRYIASNTLTTTAIVPVVMITLVHTFYTFRYGAKWMLAMVIGEYTYAIGLAFRFGLHYYPDSRVIYIAEYLLVVLSPCAFIATNYILLGRLAGHLSCTAHVLLPVQKLTLVFLSSDITTFIIQGIGGGQAVTTNLTRWRAGEHTLLAGLTLQLVSFTLFSGIYIRFLYRVYTLEHDVWQRDETLPWYRDWRTLAATFAISCIGILVRSCYRVVELSQGLLGYLATTEAFFYGLDTFPLVIAISMYVVFWPGRFIKGGTKIVDVESRQSDSL